MKRPERWRQPGIWALLLYAVGSALWTLSLPLRRGLGPLQQIQFVDPLVAARILVTGSRCIYCPEVQQRVGTAYIQTTDLAGPGSNFVDPPATAYVMQPLAHLDIHLALAVLFSLSVGAFLASAWLGYSRFLPATLPRAVRVIAVITPLVTVPVAASVWHGQWAALMLFGAAVATLLFKRGNFFLSGLVMSLLLVKFQLIWTVPFALLFAGQWRTLAGFCSGTAAWVGISMVAIGDRLSDMFSAFASAYESIHISLGLPGLVGAVTGSTVSATVATAIFSVAALVLLWRLRHRLRQRPELIFALGICLSMLVTPHVAAYDLKLLALPLWLIAVRRPGIAITSAVLLRAIQGLGELLHTSAHLEWVVLVGMLWFLVTEP